MECNWEHRFQRQSVAPFDRDWDGILMRGRRVAARRRGCASVALAAAVYGAARYVLSHPVAASVGLACTVLPWAVERLGFAEWLSRQLGVGHTRSVLFVYGTLRRGYHWHDKFMARGRFLGAAITCAPLPLVIGASGVPYVLGDVNATDGACCIRGECFDVDSFTLSDLDSYEGLSKGYYERRRVDVSIVSEDSARSHAARDPKRPAGVISAWIYVKGASNAELRSQECMPEYTKEVHAACYQPIRHILVKQLLYLNGEFATWGVPDSDAFDSVYSGRCAD